MTDQELLDQFYTNGDSRWIGLLLSRYTLLLFGVSMKYLRDEEEAKDAVQMVFLKVLTELPRYRVSYFKSWVYMICKNHCLMKLRSKGLAAQPLEDHHQIQGDEPSDKWEAEQKEVLLSRMDDAVKELNPEQRTCVQLFYLQKFSYQQISEQTGFSLQQVKSHIQNGKRNLKIILKKKLVT